jgi:hypothetical protein
MPKIKQYRPGFFTGFENAVREFNSLEELLAIDFVDNFKKLQSGLPSKEVDPNFHQFSISNQCTLGGEVPYVLMAEYEGGKVWWVVGYISETEIVKQLPVWVAGE